MLSRIERLHKAIDKASYPFLEAVAAVPGIERAKFGLSGTVGERIRTATIMKACCPRRSAG